MLDQPKSHQKNRCYEMAMPPLEARDGGRMDSPLVRCQMGTPCYAVLALMRDE